MSGSVLGSQNVAPLLWPGLAGKFGESYKSYKPTYRMYFQIEKSEKAFERVQTLTTLPLAAVKPQGASVSYMSPNVGPNHDYTHVTYGLGATVTKEAIRDELYGYINKIPGMIARSLVETKEVIGANILNKAFTTTTSADGQVLCSSAHPGLGTGGTSQRNTLQTAADFNQASLEAALIDIGDWVDENGKKIVVRPVRLLHPTELMFQVERVLMTDKAVGNNNNDINPVAGKVSPVHIPWLTDADAWFIQTDAEWGLTCFNRDPVEFGRENDFDTTNLKMKGTERYSMGASEWRGVYGSPGA